MKKTGGIKNPLAYKNPIITEATAGLTTFFTMAYIIFVNPSILATEGTGMSFDGVLTATVLLSFTMTLLMGLYAKIPFAVAPGMGINAFFTYNIILGQKIPFPIALGMIFWAGVIFMLISVTSLREQIANAIPHNLRIGAATGIGIFLSFIGLRNLGIVVSDPSTFVKFGGLTPQVALGGVGFLVSVALLRKKSPYAFLIGIFSVTLLSWMLGRISLPENSFRMPDFHSVFFKLDIWGALQWSFIPTILSVMFTDLFDSLSTFMGVSQACGLLTPKGEPKRLKQGLIVDAMATLTAGLFGTSSGTAFIESSAGIEAGGKTGMTAVFAALCFLPCLFLAPLAAIVPAYATAPILIIVGVLMFKSVAELSLSKLEDAVPAILTIILIPLTFSITQGILWGFILHVTLYLIAGRRKEIPPLLFGLGLLSIGLLLIETFHH